MTPAITATRTRTITACVLCAADLPHERCDTALPVAERATIAAPTPARPLHEYLPYPGGNDRFPAI